MALILGGFTFIDYAIAEQGGEHHLVRHGTCCLASVFVARTAPSSGPGSINGALIFIEDFGRETSALHRDGLFTMQRVALPELGAVDSSSPHSCRPGRMAFTAALGQIRKSPHSCEDAWQAINFANRCVSATRRRPGGRSRMADHWRFVVFEPTRTMGAQKAQFF
jgi:hypothetical protein